MMQTLKGNMAISKFLLYLSFYNSENFNAAVFENHRKCLIWISSI